MARLETGPSLLEPTWAHALRNCGRQHVAVRDVRLQYGPDPRPVRSDRPFGPRRCL
ncbi:hypothetical protein ACIBEA_42250 [Streptomyces sp. NPDC051555]|uniref:hypothetical protein n=1 Tax=Streptomyces sp. NPDC051555 TaxID=3365657 RepID=UPI0037B36269